MESIMRKKLFKIAIMFICFSVFNTVTAFAASEAVIKVEGITTITKGEKIEYTIYIKDVSRLYAGSIDIKFNNDDISFKQITAGSFINKDGINKMEFGGKPNEDNNKISYQFTCVGKVDGFTGEGILATVTAEGNRDCEINLNDSLKIQICERTESNDIVDIKYTYEKTDIMSNVNSIDGGVSEANSDVKDDNTNKDSIEDNSKITTRYTEEGNDISKSLNNDKSVDEENIDENAVNEEGKSKENEKGGFGIYFALGGIAVIILVIIIYKKLNKKQKKTS
jgi:hypothetical protein